MVNSDCVVNSVSRCKKLGQLTIWLTVCRVLTDLLTYKRSAWLVAALTWQPCRRQVY